MNYSNLDEFSISMNTLLPFESNPEIAVALSGGSDSMALTLMLSNWTKQKGGKIVALTVDHGLRDDAKKEANDVHKLMAKLGIEHHILAQEDTNNSPSNNIQEYARNLRYQLLTEWCKNHNFIHLFVGHTMDDQVETFLQRLQRGSGVDGLAAMPTISQRNGIRILRPLLPYTRKYLQEYLNKNDITWLEDPTNQNMKFTRNNIRRLLQDNESSELLTQRFYSTAQTIGRSRSALENITASAMAECLSIHKEGYCKIIFSKFIALTEEIALRILRNALPCIGGKEITPRSEKLISIYQEILSSNAPKTLTIGGCSIHIKNKENYLIIAREKGRINSQIILPENKPVLWDSRFSIEFCSEQSTPNKELYISNLDENEWSAIRKKYPDINKINLPKEIIYTLPVVKKLPDGGIETIMCIPHIYFYKEIIWKEAVRCAFTPNLPLSRNIFGFLKNNKVT